jgi:uncharacterized protein (UPF0335 family)
MRSSITARTPADAGAKALDKLEKIVPRVALAAAPCLSSCQFHSRFEGQTVQLQTSAKDQLRAIVARIERLEEEKAALAADLREVYAEAKGNGFDVKALRAVVRIRKQDENKRREEEAVLDTYLHALGMAEAEAA